MIFSREHLAGVPKEQLILWGACCVRQSLGSRYPDNQAIRVVLDVTIDWGLCPCEYHQTKVAEALALAAKTRVQGQNGALGSGPYVTFISASCTIARAITNYNWIDDVVYALRASSSVPDLTDPSYFGEEDIWRVKCLTDVLGFDFDAGSMEIMCTLLSDGWYDSLPGLFQVTGAVLYKQDTVIPE